MRVGFPWISLDSLVRIETFQWVTRLFAGRIFLACFPGVMKAPQQEPSVRGHVEEQDCSWGKFTLISDFLQ
jgi:hypothetical protein